MAGPESLDTHVIICQEAWLIGLSCSCLYPVGYLNAILQPVPQMDRGNLVVDTANSLPLPCPYSEI